MPFHGGRPNSPVQAGTASLSGAARAKRGIPQRGAIAGGDDVNEILRGLTSGQVSAEQLLQLLALLSGGGAPPGMGPPQPQAAGPPGTGPIQRGQPPGPAGPADPISAALVGRR